MQDPLTQDLQWERISEKKKGEYKTSAKEQEAGGMSIVCFVWCDLEICDHFSIDRSIISLSFVRRYRFKCKFGCFF